jgi:dedicator of cytokinesis protein 3
MSGPPKAGNTTSKTPTEPLDYFNPGLSEAAIVFLVVILTSSKKDMINFLESCLDIEGRDRFVSFVSQLFKMAISILDNDAFPKTWLNVNVLAHKVLIKMMESVGALLEANFIPSQDSDYPFDASLWKEAFLVLLKLLSSDQLVIEEFSPQKRRAVWRLAGDIRGEGSALMLSLWQALGWSDLEDGPGGYQLYLNSLVGHVVNLCLSHHDQLRNNAVQMLYTMIVTEHQHSGHFEVIQHELLTRLDSLFMSDSKGDDISRTFFITHLRSLFDNANVDEALQETVSEFLNSVDLFLELLLVVRALPEGEEFADDRVTATVSKLFPVRRCSAPGF